MADIVRITAQEVRAKLLSPAPPLLVLAYEDDKKFRMFGLEGAIPFSKFHAKLAGLAKDREIVFY